MTTDRRNTGSWGDPSAAERDSDRVEFGGDYEDRVWRANKLRKLKIIVANINQATAILREANDAADAEGGHE